MYKNRTGVSIVLRAAAFLARYRVLTMRNVSKGIDLTNLQVYLDRLWRRDLERQHTQNPTEVVFDPTLVEAVGPMQNVLSEFLDEQFAEIERGLQKRGVKNAQGLPLEVLFTMVTEDGTKRNRQPQEILEELPRNRMLSEDDLSYCLSEFERIKVLRRFAEDV